MGSPGANLWNGGGSRRTPAFTGASPSNRGASLWSTGEPPAARPERGGGGSLVGNLVGDVGDAIAGTVPAAVTFGTALGHDVASAFEHPLRGSIVYQELAHGHGAPETHLERDVLRPAVAAEVHQWAPLAHGDVSEWYRRFHEHPLGPVLDVLTLLSAGTSRAFALSTATEGERGAALLTGRTQGPLGEITARAAVGGEPVAIRTLPRQGARAARMLTTDKLLKTLPPDTPLVGEFSRAARGARRAALNTSLAGQADPRLENYLRAFKALTGDERVAVALLARLPLPGDYAAWLASLPADTKIGRATVKIATRPGVRAAYFDPSPKVLRAVEAGRDLSRAREEILLRTTPVNPETLAEAPYRHMRTVRGARFVPETPARLGEPSPALLKQRAEVDRLQALHDRAAARIAATEVRPDEALKAERRAQAARLVEDAIEKHPAAPSSVAWRARAEEIDRLRELLYPDIGKRPRGIVTGPGRVVSAPGAARAERIGAALSVAKDRLERMEAAAGRRVKPTGLVGGLSVDELRAEVRASGRPEPFYLPDTPASGRGLRRPYLGGEAGGRLTPERALADIHQSEQALFKTGMLALHPDVLSPAYLRAVRHDYYRDLHEQARAAAVPIEKGAGLPAGYRWLREVRGQRIPATETAAGEHLAELERTFPDTTEYEPLTVKAGEPEARVALDDQGRRLAVSQRFADDLAGEFRRASVATRLLVSRPLQVWRALVLSLRVAWLENNVLGNSLLFALRFAGPDGLKAFVGMIGQTKGAAAVRKLLGDTETRNHLTAADIAELYPEHLRGTFIGTQLPRLGGRAGRIASSAATAPLRVLPAIDRATEQALRRAAVETVLRGSSEVQTLYRAMPAQTRSWRRAMRQASRNPKLRRLVVREVNDALGDFLSLAPTERNALRNVVPFYAWYREITRIAVKLPLDAPGRTLIATRLAQVADEQNSEQLGPLPSYLRGVVPLGPPHGNEQRVLALQNANPFETLAQLAAATGGLIGAGNPERGGQQLVGLVSPFITTPADYAVMASHGQATGGLGPAYRDFAANLPEARLAVNPPSRLYPSRTRRDLITQFLGSPVKDVSLPQARFYAREGR